MIRAIISQMPYYILYVISFIGLLVLLKMINACVSHEMRYRYQLNAIFQMILKIKDEIPV